MTPSEHAKQIAAKIVNLYMQRGQSLPLLEQWIEEAIASALAPPSKEKEEGDTRMDTQAISTDVATAPTNQHAPTPGAWVWTSFSKANGDPLLTVEDIAETVAASARYSDRLELFGVSLDDAHQHEDGKATVVCYTGNGPNAHNNARAIAAMMTQGLDLLRRLVRERDHGFVYSKDREDAKALLAHIEGRL